MPTTNTIRANANHRRRSSNSISVAGTKATGAAAWGSESTMLLATGGADSGTFGMLRSIDVGGGGDPLAATTGSTSVIGSWAAPFSSEAPLATKTPFVFDVPLETDGGPTTTAGVSATAGFLGASRISRSSTAKPAPWLVLFSADGSMQQT